MKYVLKYQDNINEAQCRDKNEFAGISTSLQNAGNRSEVTSEMSDFGHGKYNPYFWKTFLQKQNVKLEIYKKFLKLNFQLEMMNIKMIVFLN